MDRVQDLLLSGRFCGIEGSLVMLLAEDLGLRCAVFSAVLVVLYEMVFRRFSSSAKY